MEQCQSTSLIARLKYETQPLNAKLEKLSFIMDDLRLSKEWHAAVQNTIVQARPIMV